MLIWNSTMDNIGRDNFILVLCMENAIVSCYVLCRAIVDFVFTRRLPKVFISSEWVQIWHIVLGVLYYAVLSPWFVLIFFSILLYDRSQSYFYISTALYLGSLFLTCIPFHLSFFLLFISGTQRCIEHCIQMCFLFISYFCLVYKRKRGLRFLASSTHG